VPIKITETILSSETYASAWLGPVDHLVQVLIDVSALTNAEVDAAGWLKPGVPFTRAGVLVGASPAFVYGVTIEPTKIHTDNTTLAAVTTDVWVGLGVIGVIIQDMAESMLGRAYTANEIAGFDRAGSKIVLIS